MLDAPVVEMDLNKLMLEIKCEATREEADHNAITIFKSDLMRIVLMGMHENAELKTLTATDTFKEGIRELEKIAMKQRTAYMYSEAMWWRCHRSMVSDYLKVHD